MSIAQSDTHDPYRVITSHILVITMRSIGFCFIFAAAVLAAPLSAFAQSPAGDSKSGRETATAQCSSCHQVLPRLFPERNDPSTTDKHDPPSFQSIADLPSTTGLSLNVFLHSNHKNMPNLILSPADSDDLIAYILSLKKQ
jgi:mono/diheme cytochrome c family protein